MQPSEALHIVASLADGVDPYTGEIFPDGNVYQNPQGVRALFMAIRALERLEARQRRERRVPESAGKPWDASEHELLCQRFDAGDSVTELAREHGRTEGAVRARLVRLGKIDARHLADAVATANRRAAEQ